MKQIHTEPKSVKDKIKNMLETRNGVLCTFFPVLIGISFARTVALKSVKVNLQ